MMFVFLFLTDFILYDSGFWILTQDFEYTVLLKKKKNLQMLRDFISIHLYIFYFFSAFNLEYIWYQLNIKLILQQGISAVLRN